MRKHLFQTALGQFSGARTDAQTLHTGRNGKCNQSASPLQRVVSGYEKVLEEA